jgi:hypothetical protein
MIRLPHRLGVLGILLAAFFAATRRPPRAVGFLHRPAQNAGDFRLRTQAAPRPRSLDDPLGGGALCQALDDGAARSKRSGCSAQQAQVPGGPLCLRDHARPGQLAVRSLERSANALRLRRRRNLRLRAERHVLCRHRSHHRQHRSRRQDGREAVGAAMGQASFHPGLCGCASRREQCRGPPGHPAKGLPGYLCRRGSNRRGPPGGLTIRSG